ncbi:hypothetical protein MMC31_007731 [Peltigera leucophlebia]|nr:hypothetical protein [Peltigera leucophlebia]
MIAIPLSLLNSALAAGSSLLSDNIELSSQAPNADAQIPQDYLWGANSLASLPPPSVAPDTVLVADRSDSENPHASCAKHDDGTKNQNLRIRNDESCAADGEATNWLKLPGWATPWKTKKKEAVEEPDESESCMGVFTPVGMALPYHLCCLGIVHSYVNGLADRISQCLFDFTKCEPVTWYNQDVCCQTFYLELGSEYATGELQRKESQINTG